MTIDWVRVGRIPGDPGFWLQAALVAALGVQAANLAWVIFTPLGPLGEWRPTRPVPPSVDQQVALFASVNPFGSGAAVTASAAPTGLKLFGVRASVAGISGSAIFGLADGTQVSVSVGEAIEGGTILAAVGFDYADVESGGARQRLFLDADKAPEAVAAGGSATAPVGAVASPLTPDALRQAVTFAPRQNGATIDGINVSPGANGAAFAMTGLRAGDVIIAVNGAKISSATDIAQLQQSLRPGTSLALTVERGGQPISLTLNLAGQP